MQNLLVAYCKKNSRELHHVQSEEVRCQRANRIGKNNDPREHQQQNSLDSFKYASFLNQQFYSPRFWNTPKKAMDEFEKIISQSNKNKCVKEQITIVQLGLGCEESHHPWSRDIYEYSSVELIEHFVKVCRPLTKNNYLPKEAPMEHPCLPEFPTLGTLTGGVDEHYSEQAKNDNQLRLYLVNLR